MPFASIYMLQKALWKADFGPNWAHFGSLYPYYGPSQPIQAMPKCVKITPKWGLGAFSRIVAVHAAAQEQVV